MFGENLFLQASYPTRSRLEIFIKVRPKPDPCSARPRLEKPDPIYNSIMSYKDYVEVYCLLLLANAALIKRVFNL